MKSLKVTIWAVFSALLIAFANLSVAAESHSVVGVAGYDLVSYHTGKKPLQGNGNHVVRHEGVNYLFASKENAQEFSANKAKYLPAYGGYCAYGVAVGKKFIGDPTVWEVVDNKLYFNLDNGVKAIWIEDIPGNIKNADKNWGEIRDVAASEL